MNIVSESLKMSQHLWSAHLRSCLFSHHAVPAEPISKFHDRSLLPLSSSPRHCCALSQPGQQDLAPHSSLLLQHTTTHQSPCSLSITVPPCHLREQFNHLWPNPSFNDVRTLQGPPAPHKRPLSQFVFSPWRVYTKADPAGYVCVWWTRCMCVWTSPAAFPHIPSLLRPWPVFGLFMSACWESPEEASNVPGKTYGTAGIQTPAVGPVRALSESLGIKGT